MQQDEGHISVLMPVIQAQKNNAQLQNAIGSVLQDSAISELIVIQDDNDPPLPNQDERVCWLRTDTPHSGPARARNLGIEHAIRTGKSTWLALCDADDSWAEGYASAALQTLEQQQTKAVLGRHRYEKDGRSIREWPREQSATDIPTFGKFLGSLFPIWRRDLNIRFEDVFAEDVLMVCQLIDQHGGLLPISQDSVYHHTLHASSLTGIKRGNIYDNTLEKCEKLKWEHNVSHRQVRQIFHKRAEIDRAYQASNAEDYHEFILKNVL